MRKIVSTPLVKENIYSIDENGIVRNIISRNQISPYINAQGYWALGLQTTDGGRRQFTIHRLLAEAFIPNPNMYPDINHKDCNRQICKLGNLEWCSVQYNNSYKPPTNLKQKVMTLAIPKKNAGFCTHGENNGMAIWSEGIVRKLCELVSIGYSYKNALIELGIDPGEKNRANLSHIIKGHRWKNVSKDYNFGK